MRRTGARLFAALMVVVLAGCGVSSGADPQPVTTGGAKGITGPSTAVLAAQPITPIAQNPQPALPVTLTDSQGTEVTITSADRILALDVYGSLSRVVFELGLGDRLVGRDISSSYPEAEHLALVTQNGHELNGESILALDPTVILTDTTLGPWDVILQMRDAGVPVLVMDSSRNMDNIGDLTRTVGDALGVPELGEQLAERTETETEAAIEEIAEIAPARLQDKLRVVFLYVRGSAGIYYMFGEDSGADSLIEAVGGYDVSGEIGWKGMRPVNDEGLVNAQPDLILMMTKGLDSVGGVDGLLERLPAIANTPAGINRRIVDMSDTDILSFGPRTPDVLRALADAIYRPEQS